MAADALDQPGLDPLLPLHWRAERARRLCLAGRRACKRDDVWVRHAVRYLCWREQSPRPEAGATIPAGLAAMHGAWGIDEGPPWPRWRLEAWLLTGVPLEEAARACEVDPGTAEAYARVHFDVLDCREARDHVAVNALPWGGALRIDPDDVGGLLKAVAFTGGPLALQGALRVLGGEALSKSAYAGLDLAGLAQAYVDLHCRFALLLRVLPLAAFRGTPLVVLEQMQRELDRLQQDIAGASATSPLEEARSAILDGLARQGTPAEMGNNEALLAERLRAMHETLDAIENAFRAEAA